MVSSTLGFVQLGQGSQVPLPLEAQRLSQSLSVVPGGQRAAGREGSRLRSNVARSVGFGARTSALITDGCITPARCPVGLSLPL